MALVGLAQALWDSDQPSDSTVVFESKWGISYWIGVIFSRGIYLVLGSLILLCMGITGIKNKLEESIENNFNSSWSRIKLQSTSEVSTLEKNTEEKDDGSDLKGRLIEAELTVLSLQKDLEMARRAQEEMEERLMENHRELQLKPNESISYPETSVATSMSSSWLPDLQALEKIKSENAVMAKNLQRALNEKSRLEEEVESMQREARIVKSAMKDHQMMALELEDLRNSLKCLKEDNESLKKDKDVAASILADILKSAYTHPLGDKNSNEVIVSIPAQLEGLINRILVRKELERKEKKKTFAPSGDEGSEEENVRLPLWSPQAMESPSSDSMQWNDEGYTEDPSLINYVPSNEMMDSEERVLSVRSSYTEAIEDSTHFLDAEEVCEGVAEIFQHPVTGSVAFQQFLQKNF